MFRYLVMTLLGSLVLAVPSLAQSPSYHLERLQIQARAFLETLEPVAAPAVEPTATVEQQLEQSTSNSVWSRQMVIDDVGKVLSAGQELSEQMREGVDSDELLAAKSTLESLARRLRVSSAALTLNPQSRTALDFLLLELEESSRMMEIQREQLLAEQRERRARNSLSIGFGYGYGGYWGVPYGWGSYYPYGSFYGPGPYYSGFPGPYGFGPRGCR